MAFHNTEPHQNNRMPSHATIIETERGANTCYFTAVAARSADGVEPSRLTALASRITFSVRQSVEQNARSSAKKTSEVMAFEQPAQQKDFGCRAGNDGKRRMPAWIDAISTEGARVGRALSASKITRLRSKSG